MSRRQWRPLAPRVYTTTTGAPPRPTRLHAALLYAGPSAILSRRTAAEESLDRMAGGVASGLADLYALDVEEVPARH
ncbi:MAG: hypothetical protein WCC38_00185 [Pseudonocardiaceae bacterium]